MPKSPRSEKCLGHKKTKHAKEKKKKVKWINENLWRVYFGAHILLGIKDKIALQIELWLYLVLSVWAKWSMQFLPLVINILPPLTPPPPTHTPQLLFLLLFHFLYPAKRKVQRLRGRATSFIHSGWMLKVDHFASNNSLVYVCTYRIWLIQR